MAHFLRFVVQEHHARSHHFDLRLEKDGVFKSWAVPKGIPDKPGIRRLALQVDDHDLSFGQFEGALPAGEYGAGRIKVWDHGTYMPIEWTPSRIVFETAGTLMTGRYTFLRFERGGPREWLLLKNRWAP